MCAGCATSPPAGAPGSDLRLPARPSFFQEVPVRPVHVDQDAREALAVREGELAEANGRIRRAGQWYDGVREDAARRVGEK